MQMEDESTMILSEYPLYQVTLAYGENINANKSIILKIKFALPAENV